MPNITDKFLINYDSALRMALKNYMKNNPDTITANKMKLTVEYMLEFNRHILTTCFSISRSPAAPYPLDQIGFVPEQLNQKAKAEFLLINEEPASANNKYSKHMLRFYKDVAQNDNTIYRNKLMERRQLAVTSLLYLSISMFSISVLMPIMATHMSNENVFYMSKKQMHEACALFFSIGIAVSFITYLSFLDLRQNKTHLSAAGVFGKQKSFKLSDINHEASVENLHRWFEESDIFSTQSLEDAVNENMDTLSSALSTVRNYNQ